MPQEYLDVVVTQIRDEAEDIRSFELRAADAGPLPPFTAGAHIDVHLADSAIRQYSLYNTPLDRDRYCIGVLREENGRGGSRSLHDCVKPGDRLIISAPRNAFPLAGEAGHSLLLAGGIGITPILSMAQHLSASGEPFDLHYCARSRNRAAFLELIGDSLPSDRVHYHFDDGPAAQLLEIPGLLGRHRPGTHLYVCGPGGFMDMAIKAAGENWPAKTIHREYFNDAPQRGGPDDTTFEVRIASTGATIPVASGQTVLAALEAEGIDIPRSCEQGICGACAIPVLAGIPDHRDLFLSDDERDANNQMTPCCSRALSDRLVLDI